MWHFSFFSLFYLVKFLVVTGLKEMLGISTFFLPFSDILSFHSSNFNKNIFLYISSVNSNKLIWFIFFDQKSQT